MAVVAGENVLAADTGPFGRHTDAWVLPAVDSVLASAGVALADLDLVAAAAGPGAFTGIRVGLATALGLASGAHFDALGISTLDALVESARAATGRAIERPVVAAIDARRGQVYAALARAEALPCPGATPDWGPVAAAPDELLEVLVANGDALGVGTGFTAYERLADAIDLVTDEAPLAASVARLAARALGVPGLPERLAPRPVYLRAPDATPPPNWLEARRAARAGRSRDSDRGPAPRAGEPRARE